MKFKFENIKVKWMPNLEPEFIKIKEKILTDACKEIQQKIDVEIMQALYEAAYSPVERFFKMLEQEDGK